MNGTLVNGQLVVGEALGHGDTLQLGPLLLEVVLDADQDVSSPSFDTTVQNHAETKTS